MKIITKILNTLMIAGLSAGLTKAHADVQYRITYDAPADHYAVYMKPDSVPAPDFSIAGQITIKVPNIANSSDFAVSNIQSTVTGAKWQLHSRSDKPVEAPNSSYLSFGMVLSDGYAPAFGWKPGIERKVFTFQAEGGCRSGVDLLGNTDPFNQLPNSLNTNPGNNFTNLGWVSANSYTGNYGGAVSCPTSTVSDELCPEAEYRKTNIERRMDRMAIVLQRIEHQKARFESYLDMLAKRKNNLGQYCQ